MKHFKGLNKKVSQRIGLDRMLLRIDGEKLPKTQLQQLHKYTKDGHNEAETIEELCSICTESGDLCGFKVRQHICQYINMIRYICQFANISHL